MANKRVAAQSAPLARGCPQAHSPDLLPCCVAKSTPACNAPAHAPAVSDRHPSWRASWLLRASVCRRFRPRISKRWSPCLLCACFFLSTFFAIPAPRVPSDFAVFSAATQAAEVAQPRAPGAASVRKENTEATVEEALEEKYTPRNCKYRPLPKSLNEFAYLSYNGEITLGDVFGLPASSIHHEQRLSFSIASEGASASSRRAILSVSVEMHRDSVAEFNHLELYRRRRGEKPHPALSASEAAAAADGAGAMLSAVRRQQAVAVGKRVEGAGGPRTKVVLSAALSDDDGDTVFDLVFSFRDSRGRTPLADGETVGHSPLLPCFPVRVDLSVVPVERMPLHIPSNCPAQSALPKSGEVFTLGETPLVLSSPPEHPFVFVFRGIPSWTPYSLPVWNMSVDVPRRLHRFARFFFRLSFRFLSGPLQLLLELFDEKSQPDPSASGPQCLLGCMGATPTYNGQLFDHAMPTGFLYKVWILAGEPMFLEDHATQCMQFDLEYRVNYETRLTPFEVGHHSWMCRFARLPTAIFQRQEGARDGPVGTVYARSFDFKDWVGFPPDEVAEMVHLVRLQITEPSDIAVSLYQANLRLRTTLSAGDAETLAELCGEKILGDNDSGMVLLHCRVPPGTYHLVLFAEYPLGGLPPCDGFYMHLTIKPLALLNQHYGCVNRSSNTMQLPPLLISPTGRPPLSAPPPSEDVIDLGVVTESREENIRSFVFRMPSPPVKTPGAFKRIAQGRFVVQSSLSQVYLHLAVLSDFTAADLGAIIRREGGDANDVATHALSFSHDYQHLVGPFDAGAYTVEIVALAPETVDAVAANSAQELCIPFVVDMRLVSRSGDDLHSSTWMCKHETAHFPRYIRGEEGVEMTLDKEFLLPASGHQHVQLQIPRSSILKIHVRSPHSSEPRLSIFPKDRPHEKLGEAYTDLFLETDMEGEYILRISFSLHSTSLAPCPTAQFHLVLVPKSSVPQCPWARENGLSRETLKTRAEEHLRTTLDSGIFIPKRIAPHHLEVAAPRDFWLSPSVHPEFAFSSDSPATSIRVELTLHPPWVPAQLLLFKRDSLGLRRKPEAVSILTENRLLLLATDAGAGDFVLKLKIYDEVDLPSERLCAHATIHAEIGDADETEVNALRAELLSLPDLMPVEPPLSSFNRRGWLSLPDVPVFSTSVFRFGEESPRTAFSSPSPADPQRSALFTVRPETEKAVSQEAVRLEERAKATVIQVEKPTLLRVTAEPAVLSRDRLLIRVFKRKEDEAQTDATASAVGAVRGERAERGREKDLLVPRRGGEDDALNFRLVEEADSNLLVLLQPGTYKFSYQAEGPFLITFGISSVDQLHRDLLFHPAAEGAVSPCLSHPPALSLPSPLPFYFESETFDIKLNSSFLEKEGEFMTFPLHVTTPSVLYVEVGSNFLLDFIKVGVRVAEGTWIGEQRGRVNFLRLILEPGTHYVKIIHAHASNVYAAEPAIKQAVDTSRCLHVSLKIKTIAVNYAGPDSDVDSAESCFSFGAMSLPLDLHSHEGGSAALGGPIDAAGRLLIRSKVVLTEANGDSRKRVALDTKGERNES
ncbi:putative transmembrane protein, partial [Toxoplasma gondii RUB]